MEDRAKEFQDLLTEQEDVLVKLKMAAMTTAYDTAKIQVLIEDTECNIRSLKILLND